MVGICVEDVDLVFFMYLYVDYVGCNIYYVDGWWCFMFFNVCYLFVSEEFGFWLSELVRLLLERIGDYIGDSVMLFFEVGFVDMIDFWYVIDLFICVILLFGYILGYVGVCIESNWRWVIIFGDLFYIVF